MKFGRTYIHGPAGMFAGFGLSKQLSSPAPDPALLSEVTALWDSRVTCSGATWTDRKGGFVLAQATAGNRPTYSATDADFGSNPSLAFDGVDDFMTSATAISSVISAGAYEVFVAVKPVSSNNNPNSYDDPYILGDNTAGYWGVVFTNPAGSNFTFKIYTWGSGDEHDDLDLSNSTYFLGFKLSGGKLYSRNGSTGSWTGGSDTASGVVDVLTGTLSMGRDSSTVNYGGFKIAALVVTNVALASSDEDNVLRYLEENFI